MRAIGIRELRQQASRYLRDVQRGETIEVTDRGRPVARLVPVPTSGLDALAESGRLAPAAGDVLELGPPLRATDGKPLPSEILAALRDDER
jgi:prevent-host-death family protein